MSYYAKLRIKRERKKKKTQVCVAKDQAWVNTPSQREIKTKRRKEREIRFYLRELAAA